MLASAQAVLAISYAGNSEIFAMDASERADRRGTSKMRIGDTDHAVLARFCG